MIGSALIAILVLVCLWSWMSWFRGRGDRSAEGEFLAKYGGRIVFVSGTRHGWYDFVVNNVVPILPPGAEVLWYSRFGVYSSPPSRLSRLRPVIDIDAFWLRRFVVPPKAPYAFILNGENHFVQELRDSLLHLKLEGSGRNEHKQRVVADQLAELLDRARS